MTRPEEREAVQHFLLELFQVEIDGRRHIEGDKLRDNQSPYDHQSQRATRGAVSSEAKRNRQCTHQRCECGHHNGPETLHAGVVNGLIIRYSMLDALLREIHDHDSVFLDNAHQHEHADERIERSFGAKEP